MPMSQHRAALAAILVAVVATFALTSTSAVAAPSPSNPVALKALSYDGTWQGECWQFVKKVVREATGNEMGFDYRQGYYDAGGYEVGGPVAQPGDIIQIVSDANSGPDADYPGLHSAIIVEVLGNGVFNVVDSNQNWDGMVHLRPDYDPAAIAASRGLNFHIYRIPVGPNVPKVAPSLSGGRPAPPPPQPGQLLNVGDAAVVYTPGDVLNLRSGPGRDYGIIARLAHGTSVTILSATQARDGLTWVKVSTAFGEGWVATDYLSKDTSKPAAPSSAGPAAPLLQYRTFVPFASAD